ncbi:histidine phosphatase family protein [Roseibium sp. RKSG952]|uniref:SixA phosphatase family protein n=1 Tax=Roseibium sp. RKSG952 TaxID=2529384 RepID=UPI0012BB9F0D|nr:histidine phosphatase family protein [Roseibium sp. RKSG952]MTI03190.1 histidine phosphatase family protein [Roseibium sp. RKSG952]
MTHTLILTRHAKSSWNHPGLTDHDRPLNKRGRKSATAIGDWLKRHSYLPDEVLSSSSTRTRETWDGMGLEASNIRFTQDLYHADPAQMLNILATAQGATVLMLGHNPGIAEFAERVVKKALDHPRFFDYPTCATTVIRFDFLGWEDLHWHSGKVQDFIIPRELLE